MFNTLEAHQTASAARTLPPLFICVTRNGRAHLIDANQILEVYEDPHGYKKTWIKMAYRYGGSCGQANDYVTIAVEESVQEIRALLA